MNSLLLKNRPKDLDEKKFKEMWENSAYTLDALFNTIKELTPNEAIKGEDFDTPNHYAKLMWQLGQRDIIKKILDLFPASCK